MVDEVGLVIVDCWFADAPLVTSWLPPPVLTPGLMFAPAFTFELLTPTFASTPTFGLTFVPVEVEEPLEGEALEVPLVELLDWPVVADWSVVDVGLVIVDCWFADAPLVTSCVPPPVLTPGLMFAPAFTFELLTPTFASTPTFGLTFVPVEVEDPLDGEELDVPEVAEVDDGLLLEPLVGLVLLVEPDD